jgi:hypothetical protein
LTEIYLCGVRSCAHEISADSAARHRQARAVAAAVAGGGAEEAAAAAAAVAHGALAITCWKGWGKLTVFVDKDSLSAISANVDAM